VKRLLLLLVFLAGGVAVAAFAVPTNAAVVNGSTISQQTLNGDVSAIAASAEYQCYLNSQAYLEGQQLPPVLGAGKGQNEGDHPTATTAFVASYLDTKIGHELVLQLADQRGVTLTQAQLDDGRKELTAQITGVMAEVAQSAEGENPAYTCGTTGQPLTGEEVLATMPASFVDQQVEFVATASALESELAGVGGRESDLRAYFEAHRAEFDTACWTVGVYSSDAAANLALTQAQTTPFSQVIQSAEGGGAQRCEPLPNIAAELPTGFPLDKLGVGVVSFPVDDNGSWLLVQVTSRTPTPFSAAKPFVEQVVQQKGAAATQKALTAVEKHSTVSVDPRYGTWVPRVASVFVPFVPDSADVPNANANTAGLRPASASPFGG
jgi:hypothetical protein